MQDILKKLYIETQELKLAIDLTNLLGDQDEFGRGLILENLLMKTSNLKVKMYKEVHILELLTLLGQNVKHKKLTFVKV